MTLKLVGRIRDWIKERDRENTLKELEIRTRQLEHTYSAMPYRTYDFLHGEHDPTAFSRDAHDKAYSDIKRLAIRDGIDITEYDERVFEARRVFYYDYGNRL